MVIGFKKQFVKPILIGTKIHTIREDKTNRWEKEKVMHMATGIRTKNYNQFAEKICTGYHLINIMPYSKMISIIDSDKKIIFFNEIGILDISKNDGFKSVEDFWKWFNKPFKGKIIYWTNQKYL